MTPSRDRTLGWFATLLLVFDLVSGFGSSRTCLSGDVVSMRYVSGDALVTGTDCIGPSGEAYPTARVADLVASMANVAQVPLRYSRGLFKESLGAPMDPRDLQKILLESQFGAPFERGSQRQRRSVTPIRNLTNREDDDDGRVNVTNTSCTPAAANDATIVPNSLCKSK
ncbi:unnamed protein product [Cyprideis torosa]|uniref:Uncharacterized protein n=1 Tax=Cyprideis torosa TaxID=163714 RepID=A0A7R8ZI39_9CRUS|nr:unnamed protein product [Cyprideis torosa]CAG0879223.1 unnamed protein product [Cyprideis torosa]